MIYTITRKSLQLFKESKFCNVCYHHCFDKDSRIGSQTCISNRVSKDQRSVQDRYECDVSLFWRRANERGLYSRRVLHSRVPRPKCEMRGSSVERAQGGCRERTIFGLCSNVTKKDSNFFDRKLENCIDSSLCMLTFARSGIICNNLR